MSESKAKRLTSELKSPEFKNRNYEELKEMVDLAMKGEYDRVGTHSNTFSVLSKRSRSMYSQNNDDLTSKNGSENSRFIPTMREIKYLFEKLVGAKYEKEMKPDYEKQMNEDLERTKSNNNLPLIKENSKKTISVPRQNANAQMKNFTDISKIKLLEFANSIDRNNPNDKMK